MSGKSVLITGSSKGLGEELAVVFAMNNYGVILHGRNNEDLSRVEKKVAKIGVRCDILSGDLKLDKTIKGLYKLASKRNVSVLVNNAGIDLKTNDAGSGLKLPLNEISDNQIDELLTTNLLALIKLTRRLYPLFLEKGKGTIVNINSVSGLECQELKSIYCASKWGLRGFTDSLRLEARKHGIRVVGVYPSRIKTKAYFPVGMEPREVALKIYNAYNSVDVNELILDEREKK